ERHREDARVGEQVRERERVQVADRPLLRQPRRALDMHLFTQAFTLESKHPASAATLRPPAQRRQPTRVGGLLGTGLMKEAINKARDFVRNPGDGPEVSDIGPADRLGGAEMPQKRTFPRRPDAGDLVQRIARNVRLPPRAVRADRKAVRLVAQTL